MKDFRDRVESFKEDDSSIDNKHSNVEELYKKKDLQIDGRKECQVLGIDLTRLRGSFYGGKAKQNEDPVINAKEEGSFSKRWRRVSDLQFDELSSKEKEALKDYTGAMYKKINAYLSKNYDELLDDYASIPEVAETAKTIHNCLDKCSLPMNCTVYRGTSLSRLLGEDIEKHSITELNNNYCGRYLLSHGFASCSSSFNVAKKFSEYNKDGVIIKLDITIGANAIAIGKRSIQTVSEDEVLVQNEQYIIIDKYELVDNRIIIKARLD